MAFLEEVVHMNQPSAPLRPGDFVEIRAAGNGRVLWKKISGFKASLENLLLGLDLDHADVQH